MLEGSILNKRQEERRYQSVSDSAACLFLFLLQLFAGFVSLGVD